MSAGLRPFASDQDPERAFYDSQQLPPEKRGGSFEALFFRQLQQVTTRIHDTDNLDQIMLESSQDICRLFNADRLTLYAVNGDRTAIVSKVKTGLNASRDLKLPISVQSIAGYAALSGQLINLADVYDEQALRRIHPRLTFLQEVDRRSGYRTRQMLMAEHQIRPAQIGPSLARFFGVPYEPFSTGRIRSEMLHASLKRDFIEEQGWIPLEESPEGLVVMCVDPEAVRGSRVVPQVFPRFARLAYRVTTQTEFEETLGQLFGAGSDGGSIDQLLADLNGPLDEDGGDDSALESAAADNELVGFRGTRHAHPQDGRLEKIMLGLTDLKQVRSVCIK